MAIGVASSARHGASRLSPELVCSPDSMYFRPPAWSSASLERCS